MLKGFWFFVKFSWENNSKKYILVNILLAIFMALSSVINVLIPKYVIDSLIYTSDFNRTIGIILIAFSSMLLISYLVEVLRTIRRSQKSSLFMKFQMLMSKALLKSKLEDLESFKYKVMYENAKKYVYSDGNGFAFHFEQAFELIGIGFSFLGIISIIAMIDLNIIIFLILFSVILSVTQRYYLKKEQELFKEKAGVEVKTYYYTTVANDYEYAKDIRLYNYQDKILDEMNDCYSESQKFYKKMAINGKRKALISNLFMYSIQGISYAIVGYMLFRGDIDFASFTVYTAATVSLYNLFNSFIEKFIYLNQFDEYYDDFKEFLKFSFMPSGSKKPEENGVFEFKNVSFKYPGAKEYALKDVNCRFRTDENISIVGENGSGKSTFIKLLTRIYVPTSGEILYNGVPVEEYSIDEYSNLFSPVFQDFKIFASTISENIVMDHVNDRDKNRIMDIVKSEGLLEDLITSKDDLEVQLTKNISDEGVDISGGQRQQLAILRALFKDSKIIVLDEPMSALDPNIEYKIYQQFYNMTKNKCTLLVTHRLAGAKFTQRVVVFSKGVIIEDGNIDELMSRETVFRDMFKKQSELYI